jgi:putative ABC transport system permease protein
MKLAWKLVFAYIQNHPARVVLTSLAMIASTCIVVWLSSTYDAMAGKFGDTAQEYLGRYDLFFVPDSQEDAYVPADFLDALEKDADIAEIEPVFQARLDLVRSDSAPPGMGMGMGGKGGRPGAKPGERPAGPPNANQKPSPSGAPGSGSPPARPMMFFGSPNLVGTRAVEPPYPLTEGRWIAHDNPALRETVISNLTAEQLNLKLGDDAMVILGTKEYHLKVVGITKQVASQPLQNKPIESATGRPVMRQPTDATIGPASSALYVPMALAEKIAKRADKINLVSVKLKSDADAAKFRERWVPQAARTVPPLLVAGHSDLKAALEMGMMAANAKKQAWAATGMSLVVAFFIILATLSMGINERIRQFAMMRAVGLTRGQIASVIFVESLLWGMIGWSIGLAAGGGLLALFARIWPETFGDTHALGTWTLMLSGLSALGGPLVASIFPAWKATAPRPLDALSHRRSTSPSMAIAVFAAIVGVVLVCVNPILIFAAPIPDDKRYMIYEIIGIVCMAIGVILLAPLAMIAVERILGPVVAKVLRVEPRLLAAQLSGNLWRTLGTTVALTVGLGLFVWMMVWGYSMLQPFKPGAWVPDVLAAFQSGGLPDAEIEAIRKVPGVIPEQCIPLAVDQPRLAEDITKSKEGQSVTRQDNVIIIGLDPDVAFGGKNPLIKAQFTEGTAAEAIAKLKQGRYCIVPDHFLVATGLRLGDRFTMLPPEQPDKPVEYTIAGAVSLPGWHWMTKFSGLRRRSGRSAAMVFAPYEEVRRDFYLTKLNFFWMNIDKTVGVDKIGEAMQPIADRNIGEKQPVNGQGTMPFGAQMFGESLRISTPEEVRTRIIARADAWIWGLCVIPLIALAVTSLGVVNTIAASVRARRWELGVLRALGVTRGAMIRMILAEGMMIGAVACVLSLVFGVVSGWCATGISQHHEFFGGLATPLFIPWLELAIGLSFTIFLCLLAALWPAISTGRTEPLKLLQAGRSSL